MNVDQEIHDGREAAQLLEHPLYKRAFDAIESSLIDKLRHVAMADIDTQHELVLSLQLLANVRRQIETVVQTGKMAQIQKETMLDKLKRKMR
jgi:hypothetical protein